MTATQGHDLPGALNPDDVAAVCHYMNTEVPQSLLYIVRKLGGLEGVVSTNLVTMTPFAAVVEVTLESGETTTVELAWPDRVIDRSGMRQQLFALLDKASVR